VKTFAVHFNGVPMCELPAINEGEAFARAWMAMLAFAKPTPGAGRWPMIVHGQCEVVTALPEPR
jgi:hypothetical protein